MDENRWVGSATMKMFKALATGTWIVSIDWLYACDRAEALVAEDTYVMQGVCLPKTQAGGTVLPCADNKALGAASIAHRQPRNGPFV